MSKDFTEKQKNTIRKAAQAGKRTVVVDGVKLKLTKQVRHVTYTVGRSSTSPGESVKAKETWIVARPADKNRLTPVYSVAPIGVSNSRVTT